ncbi:tetratricopeptide repeat protein [bacterium]|nr:tetratricopeptide repeat protein [bacterium]
MMRTTCKKRKFKKSAKIRFIISFLASSFAFLSGCAYFNTYYNAERYYKEGLNNEEKSKGSGRSLFQKSLEKAVTVAKKYPDSRWVDDAFFLIAMNYYWMERYDKALPQFEGFIENFPESPYIDEARFRHALALIEQGRYSEGRVELNDIFPIRKYSKKARFAWADAFRKEKDWPSASKAFSDFLELYPFGEISNEARINLAEIELAGGDTLNAIKVYERYLKRAETSKDNYARGLTLANLYYISGSYSNSSRTLKQISGRYPDIDEQAELIKGKIALVEGDTSEALKILARVPRGSSGSRAEAFYLVANIFEQQGKYELAISYYDTISTSETKSNYSAIAERKKTLLESRISSDTTDQADIDPAKEQFLLAESYLLSIGDARRALAEYEKVSEEHPESEYAAKSMYGIIWIKRYKLNDPSWRNVYEKLLERYPESQAAKEALNLLNEDGTPQGDSS